MRKQQTWSVVRAAVAVVLVAGAGMAAAQFEVIGTATGTLDGENRTWYFLGYEGDEGPDGTARLESMAIGPVAFYSLDLQGHAEARYLVAGTLSVTGTTWSSLESCPCTFDESEVMYFSSPSMFEAVYQSLESEVVIESIEFADGVPVALRGRFTALLGFMESALSSGGPDPERAIEVAGEFAIDHVVFEGE